MRRSRWLAPILGAVLLLALPPATAWAGHRQKIEWTAVDVRLRDRCPEPRAAATCSSSPSSQGSSRAARMLKTMLQEASRKADWGKGPTLRLSASITELTWEQHDDVLRLEVAVVGRIVGAASVRSRIRVGGRPAERSKLEREALQIVSTGLVTRLADIARKAAAP
jgi:hypothetical protein